MPKLLIGNLFKSVSFDSAITAFAPSSIQESFIRTGREIGDKVDSLYRGVHTWAYQSPRNNRNQDLADLGKRAKFINPTLQEFLKTAVFFGLPAALGLRAALPMTQGFHLPIATVAVAIVGVTSLAQIIGFMRVRSDDLETALHKIIKCGRGDPDATFENLPVARFVDGQLEMGNHPVAIIKSKKTKHQNEVKKESAEKVDFVVFRYVEKTVEGDKFFTRVYSIGKGVVSTGCVKTANHTFDVTTSLEGCHIKDLLKAAQGQSLTVDFPTVPSLPLHKRIFQGIATTFCPDVTRQIITHIVQEILAAIDSRHCGKGTFAVGNEEKNSDLKFLASRNYFYNPILKEDLKALCYAGLPALLSIRSIASLKIGPYLPVLASFSFVVASWSISYLAGIYRQHLAGNDLEKALEAILRIGMPGLKPQPGHSLLDYLPANNSGEQIWVEKVDSKIQSITFNIEETVNGKKRITPYVYNIGQQWSNRGTPSLESKHIQKLIDCARQYYTLHRKEIMQALNLTYRKK